MLRSALRLVARYREPVLWLAYLLIPVAGWGLFDGRPLDIPSLVAVAVVVWLWFARRRIGPAPVVASALALKLALGTTLLLPDGLDVRYYANADLSGAVERGSEPATPGFTRVDRELSFGTPNGRDLPQYFFNDVLRFNFRGPAAPDRGTLPVSAAWQGLLRVPDAGPQLFYLRASGATVTLAVGDLRVASLGPGNNTWSGVVALRAGYEPILVTASIGQGVPRHVEAGRIIAGREVPFGADVFRRAASPLRHLADEALRAFSLGVDALLCAWLALACVRALREAWPGLRSRERVRSGLVLGWAVILLDVVLFALPLAHRAIILSGGDDWLTYESFARDIVINSIWMPQGAPLGQGEPFYFQPFYPYFVAACHWLAGDGLVGVYFVHRLLAGATVMALWRLTAILFGERAGAAGLVTAVLLVYTKFEPWTRVLLSETFFIPVIAILACLLARLMSEREPRPWRAALAGALGGIATLTRTSLLLGWVLVVPAIALALRRRPRAGTAFLVFVAALALVTSLAAVRNWVVAHRFVATATSGSYVLKLGNPAKSELIIPEDRRARYEAMGVDGNTQHVVELVRQRPGEFFAGWLDKAAYTLGWFGVLLPGTPTAWFYILSWIVTLCGLAFLPRIPAEAPAAARLVPLFLAASVFATLVVFLPHVYGDRMILPFYILLVPYAAVALERVHRWLAEPSVDLAGPLGWLAALAATAGIHVFGDRTVLVAIGTLAVAALCVAPVVVLSWRTVLPYLPLAVAMLAIFFAKPALAEASTRAHLLVLAVAIVAGVHVRSRRAIVLVATALATGGVLTALVKAAGAGSAGLAAATERLLSGSDRFIDFAFLASAFAPALLAVGLALRRSQIAAATAFYAAGVAIVFAALPASADARFSWELVRSVISVLGIAGVTAYAVVWAWTAWPGRLREPGAPAYSVRLLQGAVAGIFAAGQAGVGIKSLEVGPVLVIAGLVFAAIHVHRQWPGQSVGHDADWHRIRERRM